MMEDMTMNEATEPTTEYQVDAGKVIESLQRQIAQQAATHSLENAKAESIISQLQEELRTARQFIDQMVLKNGEPSNGVIPETSDG